MFAKVVKFLLWAPVFLVISLFFAGCFVWVLLALQPQMQTFFDKYFSFLWLCAFLLLLLWVITFFTKTNIDKKWRFMDIILFRFLLVIDFVILSIWLFLMTFSAAWCNARSPWCPNAYSYWAQYVHRREEFDGYVWFVIPLFFIIIGLFKEADDILRVNTNEEDVLEIHSDFLKNDDNETAENYSAEWKTWHEIEEDFLYNKK